MAIPQVAEILHKFANNVNCQPQKQTQMSRKIIRQNIDVILQIGSIGGGDGEEGGGSGLGGGGLGDGGDDCAGRGLGVGGVDGGVGDVVCDLPCVCALQCYLQPAYVSV